MSKHLIGAYAYVTKATAELTGQAPRTLEQFIADHARAFARA